MNKNHLIITIIITIIGIFGTLAFSPYPDIAVTIGLTCIGILVATLVVDYLEFHKRTHREHEDLSDIGPSLADKRNQERQKELTTLYKVLLLFVTTELRNERKRTPPNSDNIARLESLQHQIVDNLTDIKE